MSALWTALAVIIKAVLGAFFERKDAAQQRVDDRAAGTRDAAIETNEAINDIADKREALPPVPNDADDLVRWMRERAAADRAAASGRDPKG